MRYVVVMISVLLLFGAVQVVAAQEKSASAFLPPANRIGEDWGRVRKVPTPSDLPAAFTDAAYATYGGPRGARVVLAVFVVAEGITAVRDSWELANGYFEAYRSEIDYQYDSNREDALEERERPEGCADARRTYGVDTIGFESFYVGLTLCAADPDVILLAYASGPVPGGPGYQASDDVVEAALMSHKAMTSPSATPTE